MKITKKRVIEAAQLACILDATVPKPGNVSRHHDFADTKYEHFLASGIAIGEAVSKAFEFGKSVEKNKKEKKPMLGKLILRAVEDSKELHRGKNTNLGIAMLLIPLAAALGMSRKIKNLNELRSRVDFLIKNSTPQDTVYLYRAVRLSGAEVGRSERFDVNAPDIEKKVLKKNMNLHKVFKIASWDTIARELATGMEITFNISYPALLKEFKKANDISKAALRAFFVLLSKVPDTLIERKKGRKAAEEVSKKAGEILKAGLKEEDVRRFDAMLRKEGNALNPGTTADLICASLMMLLLKEKI